MGNSGKQGSSPLSVLIVEDNDAHARLAQKVMQTAGYRCERAASAEEALKMIAAAPPDLVLMDIMLSGMTGLEAIARLRADEATRALPVIAVTSHRAEFPAEEAMRAGADAFIAKPYHYADLIELGRNLLARREKGPGRN